jgi:hypothetical protein
MSSICQRDGILVEVWRREATEIEATVRDMRRFSMRIYVLQLDDLVNSTSRCLTVLCCEWPLIRLIPRCGSEPSDCQVLPCLSSS